MYKALDEREVANVAVLRAMESDRVDWMLRALWPKSKDGDVEAIHAALRITDRRIKLLGLDRRSDEHGDQGFVSMLVDGTGRQPRAGNAE